VVRFVDIGGIGHHHYVLMFKLSSRSYPVI